MFKRLRVDGYSLDKTLSFFVILPVVIGLMFAIFSPAPINIWAAWLHYMCAGVIIAMCYFPGMFTPNSKITSLTVYEKDGNYYADVVAEVWSHGLYFIKLKSNGKLVGEGEINLINTDSNAYIGNLEIALTIELNMAEDAPVKHDITGFNNILVKKMLKIRSK